MTTTFLRHLLATQDLSKTDALRILDTAAGFAAQSQGGLKKFPTLRGRTVVNLFYEDSTRTRISFEAAAKRLSADVINFAARGSSVSKGEGLKDTAQTLAAMGADAIVIRHPASGAAHRLANSGWTNAAILNAGDGMHEHPTQALLDAYTIRKHLRGNTGDLQGLRVGIVGDIIHSRVARSNIFLLTTLGAAVTLIAPATLIPNQYQHWPVEISYDLDSVLPHLDVVMMLRVQRERMGSAFFPSEREYRSAYGLDQERLRRLQPEAVILHPGPMNRGLEISSEVADSPRALILDQVRNGIIIRMAALYLLLGGEGGMF